MIMSTIYLNAAIHIAPQMLDRNIRISPLYSHPPKTMRMEVIEARQFLIIPMVDNDILSNVTAITGSHLLVFIGRSDISNHV